MATKAANNAEKTVKDPIEGHCCSATEGGAQAHVEPDSSGGAPSTPRPDKQAGPPDRPAVDGHGGHDRRTDRTHGLAGSHRAGHHQRRAAQATRPSRLARQASRWRVPLPNRPRMTRIGAEVARTTLAELERLDRKALVARWTAFYGHPAPRHAQVALLKGAIAWDCQRLLQPRRMGSSECFMKPAGPVPARSLVKRCTPGRGCCANGRARLIRSRSLPPGSNTTVLFTRA